jgi:hypothetical protein
LNKGIKVEIKYLRIERVVKEEYKMNVEKVLKG